MRRWLTSFQVRLRSTMSTDSIGCQTVLITTSTADTYGQRLRVSQTLRADFTSTTVSLSTPSKYGKERCRPLIHDLSGSNGNRFWSQGPPLQDAHITVSYVKAYFNSTNATRVSEYTSVCPSSNVLTSPEMCEIPNQDTPPNPLGRHGNTTGHTFFFTANPQMNVNQTVYHNSASLSLGNTSSWLPLAATSLTLGVALSLLVGSG